MSSSWDLKENEPSDSDTCVDHIIDDFEERWRSGAAPNILLICQEYFDKLQNSDASQQFADLALELAIVDIELSWRMGGPNAKRSTDWYRRHLSHFGLDERRLRILAFNELEVRSRWGDAPRVATLVNEQFPDAANPLLTSIASQFIAELELRLPIVCTIGTETSHRFRIMLKTPCIIGRQRSTDPSVNELRFCQRDQLHRLVIAGKTENFISRKQLMLERLSVNELRVTPLSESIPCFIGSRRLPPDTGTVLTISKRGSAITFGGFMAILRSG